jgi:ABC-type Fe3+ transport system substrate-binding protein
MKFFGRVVLSFVFLHCVWLTPAGAVEAKTTREKEWNEAIDASTKDGELTVYHTRGPFEKLFADFNKRYPGIKITSISGRGGDLISRIMAERRAGKFLADIYLGSTGTPLDVLYPAKVLEPVAPFLLLPEVRDQSSCFGKRHHYGDAEEKFIFVFEGVVRSDMAYKSKLVDAKEFTSYWDLVKPKWKGKIAAIDPKLAGFPEGLIQFAYYHPDLGAKFLR